MKYNRVYTLNAKTPEPLIFTYARLYTLHTYCDTMGIRQLNKYLQQHCKSAITPVTFADIAHKTIAVDISIYMYYFEGDGALFEKMLFLLHTLHVHHIHGIFVFDGKPPPEKMQTLYVRAHNKKTAQAAYDELVVNNKQNSDSYKAKQLKKQCVRLSAAKIQKVKELIASFGMSAIDAPNEADDICAILAVQQIAWAVLSDDTDMFTRGCPRVLRYLALNMRNPAASSMSLVDTAKIRDILAGGVTPLTPVEFTEICVASGTDYNCSVWSISDTIARFNKYKLVCDIRRHSALSAMSVPIAPAPALASFLTWVQCAPMQMPLIDADPNVNHGNLGNHESAGATNHNDVISPSHPSQPALLQPTLCDVARMYALSSSPQLESHAIELAQTIELIKKRIEANESNHNFCKQHILDVLEPAGFIGGVLG